MKIEWKILKANADTERAQLNKVLADIADSISESASATLAQANITATMATEEGLNGFASAWRETFARVYEIDGTVTAIAQDVTALEARVDNVETGESGNSQAIQTLTARVDANEDGIIATASDVTALEASVYDPVTGLTATAGAVESLEVQVNSINDTVMAAYTLTLDANGYITGWKFTNDGTTGEVDFRADRFSITAPGSVKSVEFADGILMSNTGTHSYYMGVDFGTASDLITWYGPTPTAGASGANPANGLFWIKNDGSGYFGGGLSNTVVTNLPIIVNHESRLDTIEATYTDPVTGLVAAHARISEEATVRANADSANATSISALQATLGNHLILRNPGFEQGTLGWSGSATGPEAWPASVVLAGSLNAYSGSYCALFQPNDGSGRALFSEDKLQVSGSDVIRLRMRTRTAGGGPNVGANIRMGLRQYDAGMNYIGNYYPISYTSTGTGWLYDSVVGLQEAAITVEPTCRFVQVILYSEGHTSGGSIAVDALEVSGATLTDRATSSALTTTQVTVGQQGDTLTAHTSQISQLQNDLSGKASQTALNSLSQTVTNQGGEISGVQDALTLLEQEVDDKVGTAAFNSLSGEVDTLGDQAAANATAITGVSARVGQSTGNLILKGQFDDGSVGGWVNATIFLSGIDNRNYLRVSGSSYEALPGGAFNRFPVQPGDQVDVTAERIQYGSLLIRFYDKAGAVISSAGVTGGSSATKQTATVTAPANAVWGAPAITVAAGQTYAYLRGLRATVRTLTESQNATATQTLRADVDTVTGEVNAMYGVELDVNGYATGFESVNDGSTGSFTIRADKFSIVSPSGGARTEYSNGNWRVYDANGVLRVRLGVW